MEKLTAVFGKIKYLIKDGFLHILFGNTLVKMISFISSIVIVNLVAKTHYAYLNYADNLYAYIDLFSGLGMSAALLKYCATIEEKEKDKAYLSFALKNGIVFQLTLSVILSVAIIFLDIPFPQAKPLIWMLILYPVLNFTVSAVQCYIRAHRNNRLFSTIAVVQTLVVFLGSVGFVLLLDVKGVVVARYLAVTCAILLGLVFIKRRLSGVKTVKLERSEKLAFRKMGISLMIASFFSMVMPVNEMFLVNTLLQNEVATANYKVAINIPSQTAFITSSIVIYFFPIIAKMATDKLRVWKTSKRIGYICFGIVALITVLGILITPWLFHAFYGGKYDDAIPLAYVVWVVYAFNSGLRMIPMNILPAIGKTAFNAGLSVVSCGVQFVLDYVFIKNFGIMGAVYATGIVYLLSGIAYWIYLGFVCKGKPRKGIV